MKIKELGGEFDTFGRQEILVRFWRETQSKEGA
jgi:hypothetical protein